MPWFMPSFLGLASQVLVTRYNTRMNPAFQSTYRGYSPLRYVQISRADGTLVEKRVVQYTYIGDRFLAGPCVIVGQNKKRSYYILPLVAGRVLWKADPVEVTRDELNPKPMRPNVERDLFNQKAHADSERSARRLAARAEEINSNLANPVRNAYGTRVGLVARARAARARGCQGP